MTGIDKSRFVLDMDKVDALLMKKRQPSSDVSQDYKTPPNTTKTTITLADGNKVGGYIKDSRAYLDNGSRIPEGASVVTGGGEFRKVKNGSRKISNTRLEQPSAASVYVPTIKKGEGFGGYESKYWKPKQFRCRDGSSLPMSDALLRGVDALNDATGGTLSLHSAYRSPEYNAKIGGAENSYHMKGMAVDISSPNYTPKELKKLARSMGVFGGIGVYDWGIHVDVGPTRNW